MVVYPKAHFSKPYFSLERFDAALDGSDTGTGKTYSAMCIAAILGLRPFVICPKSVISTWRKVAKIFSLELYSATNYESVKFGRYYNDKEKKEKCPYIEVLDGGRDFKWNLPADCMLVFDEVHKCKNPKSVTSKLLTRSKDTPNKVLMLSATVSDKPKFFSNVAYMLDFCTNIKVFKYYLMSLQQQDTTKPIFMLLHQKIYPNKGSRMRIAELGDLFPSNQVIAETYTMGDDIERQIEEQYHLLSVAVNDLKNKEAEAVCPLTIMLRARQKIKALKVQAFIELARDYIENGFSVVIFTNFTDTLNLLANKLKTDCLIHGGQTLKERDRCVENFQENKERLLIANIASGGQAISLHDIHGGHPRVSLISPTWSAQALVQALGRIYRAKGKTPCLQRIIFCANTVEIGRASCRERV